MLTISNRTNNENAHRDAMSSGFEKFKPRTILLILIDNQPKKYFRFQIKKYIASYYLEFFLRFEFSIFLILYFLYSKIIFLHMS